MVDERKAKRNGGGTSGDGLDHPEASARAAGLRYVDDSMPGFTRLPWGRGFTYRDADGETVRDPEARRRFEALAIPPAWTEVWICRHENGHLQATGRDDRGRKQYRYHDDWLEVRERTKFDRMRHFGRKLPVLRKRIDADLRRHGLPRERVLAAVVRLLETSLIRVGNDEYARDNGSYGLTTLRRRHADVTSTKVRFEFTAKGGIERTAEITDRRLARVVKGCQELYGQELFTYLDDDDERRDVTSGDVNDYLREATGEAFTAKDFRTWGGTTQAVALLRGCLSEPESEEGEEGENDGKAAEKQVVEAIRCVAERLGNTPAVCRQFYVHPGVVEAFHDGRLAALAEEPTPRSPRGLDADERFALALLERVVEE